MAGSRLDKIGTIFSRATGLLRSGAIKYQDRPLWYDIYRVFPPKYEPHVDREPEKAQEIPNILYKEDKPRAEFFKRFGSNPGGDIRHLNDLTYEEASQVFIKKFQELEKSNQEWTFEQTFNSAVEAYQLSRPNLIRRSQKSERKSSVIFGSDDSSKDIYEEQNRVILQNQHERKTPLITPESLRSLFEEAKDKQKKESEAKHSSADTDKEK